MKGNVKAGLGRKGLVLVLCAAVPSALAPSVAGASPPAYYLWQGAAEVALVQIEVTGSSVVGEFYANTLQGSPPSASVVSSSSNFHGSDHGNQLTLYFPNSSSGPIFGQLRDQSLSLELPQTDGSLGRVVFAKTSIAIYNNLLSQWRQRVAREDASAAAAAQQASQAAEAKKQLYDEYSASIQQVDDDLSAMQSPGTLGEDQGVLGEDLGTLSEDLAVVSEDNSVFTEDGESGTNPCSDILNAYSDAHTVYSDGESMLSDARSGVGGDIRDEQQTMAQAPGDWATYWNYQHREPGYRPTTPIPPLKVALAQGQGVIDGAVGQVNSDVDHANSYVERAYVIVNAAAKANRCGPVKAAPVIGHVSERWLTS